MTHHILSMIRKKSFNGNKKEFNMAESLIQDWLAEYSALSPVEKHSYASTVEHNDEVINAVYSVLEDRYKYPTLVDPVCNQLFSYYRSTQIELKRFTIQFIPTLLYIYLNSVAHQDKKSCRSIETLLIGIYNLGTVQENGQPVVLSFRLPSLAQASVYHDPMSLAHASLTETALRRLEECNTKLVSWGPLPPIEMLNAQNRLKVMTALLFVFNRHIGTLNKSSLKSLSKIASQLVTQGFLKPGQSQRSSYASDSSSYVPRVLPRIPVNSQFLLELLAGLYYALFNDHGYLTTQAIDDVYNRGCFESYADVILVARAVRSSSHTAPTGQATEGPMGISVALSPATTTVTTSVKKSMITNASFRTKKLPDDIPIVPKEDGGSVSTGNVQSGGVDAKNLTSISEEKEEEGGGGGGGGGLFAARGSSLRETVAKNRQKLSNLPGLGKKLKESRSSLKNGGLGEKQEKKTMLPMIGVKERKVSSQSVHGYNGGEPGVSLDNGPVYDNGAGLACEVMSDAADSTESFTVDDDAAIGGDKSPKLNDADDKPLMQVSSV